MFVSVVDPGVGTARRGCVAKLNNGSFVVTPDNGSLTAILDWVVAVREIDESEGKRQGEQLPWQGRVCIHSGAPCKRHNKL